MKFKEYDKVTTFVKNDGDPVDVVTYETKELELI